LFRICPGEQAEVIIRQIVAPVPSTVTFVVVLPGLQAVHELKDNKLEYVSLPQRWHSLAPSVLE
jgi:hypothetical protein